MIILKLRFAIEKIKYCDCLHDSRVVSVFTLGTFFLKLEKKQDILDWEWGRISALVIGRKGPGLWLILNHY